MIGYKIRTALRDRNGMPSLIINTGKSVEDLGDSLFVRKCFDLVY